MAGGAGGGETIAMADLRPHGSRSRGPAGLHSKIHLQPGSQGHRDPVLLPGADGGVRRHVPVAADAHPHDLADGESAAASARSSRRPTSAC